MSTPTLGAPSNGHLSPDNEMDSTLVTRGRPAESDLSDSHDHTADESSPSPSDDANELSNGPSHAHNVSESDNSSEDNASEDADFDMEESLPSQHDEAVEERASSADSNRVSKRKAPVEEDAYIKANPELYGLRRSVRHEINRSAFSI